MKELKKGEVFQLEEASRASNMLMIMEGKIVIDSLECHNYEVEKENFIFCYSNYAYRIEALEQTVIIIAFFETLGSICDITAVKNMSRWSKNMEYHFTSAKFNEPLKHCLANLRLFLEGGMPCINIHQTKMQELIIIVKFYYPIEEQLQIFHNLYVRNMSFESLIMNNYLQAKTVEELADMCGYSVSYFKMLFKNHFKETPYVWMRKKKMMMVKKDLLEGDRPLKEVIEKFGFSGYAQLRRYCVKYMGISPSGIRKAGKED